jgi:hypothetical protein
MSRCAVCDYSDDHPSITADGLTDGHQPRTFRAVRGETLCSVCRPIIGQTVAEYNLDDTNGADGQWAARHDDEVPDEVHEMPDADVS